MKLINNSVQKVEIFKTDDKISSEISCSVEGKFPPITYNEKTQTITLTTTKFIISEDNPLNYNTKIKYSKEIYKLKDGYFTKIK